MSKRKLRATTTKDNVERNDLGKFIQRCGCVMHEQWSNDSLYEVRNIKKSKVFGNNIIRRMRNEYLLPQKSNVLCTACYKVYKNRYSDFEIFLFK